MCEYTSHEYYKACHHTVPCHLKYSLRYCQSPNGTPLPDPSKLKESGFCPSRCCDMDKWKQRVMRVEGKCLNCVETEEGRVNDQGLEREREREQQQGRWISKERLRRLMAAIGRRIGIGSVKGKGEEKGEEEEEEEEGVKETSVYRDWDIPDTIHRFECGHCKFWIRGDSVQKCLHVVGGVSGDGRGVDVSRFPVEEGDWEIVDFWGTQFRYSVEEVAKIKVQGRHVRGLCGGCQSQRFRAGVEAGLELGTGGRGQGESPQKYILELEEQRESETKESSPSPQIPPVTFEDHIGALGALFPKFALSSEDPTKVQGALEKKRWGLRTPRLITVCKGWVRTGRRKKKTEQ
ncbi:hypothetical protein GX48_02049 [Paracoccidioides brasiliensis]|nr:hypothetical protein GX48_02049 [Paracoccidioides brasiliensis]